MPANKLHDQDPTAWWGGLVHHPWDTAHKAWAQLMHYGYFDPTTLWRQFYDSAVPEDHLRWYNILIYIAGCLIFIYVIQRRQRGKVSLLDSVFPPEVRRSASFRTDVQYFIFAVLKGPLFIVQIVSLVLFVNWLPNQLQAINLYSLPGIGFINHFYLGLSPWLQPFAVYVVALLSNELGYYWAHRLAHISPVLWQFHKVHHYSRQLNPLIGARFHPMDTFLLSTFSVFCMSFFLSLLCGFHGQKQAVELASGHWWFWPAVLLPTVGGRFVHSHVPISWGWLDRIFVSPAMHIVHHSREVHDTNFGQILSIWDIAFGSYYQHDYTAGPVNLGIQEVPDDHYKHIGQMILEPFADAWKELMKLFSGRRADVEQIGT